MLMNKLPEDIVEFLIDHPMAVAVVRGMMKKSATTGDDPKQAAKLCSHCGGFDGKHGKLKNASLTDCPLIYKE
jgi:hypothetical protein